MTIPTPDPTPEPTELEEAGDPAADDPGTLDLDADDDTERSANDDVDLGDVPEDGPVLDLAADDTAGTS